MQQPRMLWTPNEDWVDQSHLHHYRSWLIAEKEQYFFDYQTLWQWSIDEPSAFWESLTQYFQIKFSTPYHEVISSDAMPHTRWFSGAKLNYAEHIFRNKTDQRPAILYKSEGAQLGSISWQILEQKVAAVQQFLMDRGVRAGDTVAAYLPNIPEASIAFLATISMGAVWSVASPDFGVESVVERFEQIAPKVLFTVDGYRYNGKTFNRVEIASALQKALPSVHTTIMVQFLGAEMLTNAFAWSEVLQTPNNGISFTQVDFSHPLWVLYSSGTTGAPKAMVHGHGGVLLEHLKYLAFHNDVHEGEVFFWYSTTGWMMWNFMHAALLMGATIVLYDGSPAYPDLNALWQLAEEAGIHHFGTSAPFIMACNKAGIRPADLHLSSLRSIGSTGAPLSPEAFSYVYEQVKPGVWLCSMSGGSDVCTAFVGGNPWWPVYEGEIQCRALGCAMDSWDENGKSLRNVVGEMVITKPMPSMPLFFWNDPNFERYHESYFSIYPGVWRHGDWLEITERNGLIIHGRSDATLNKQGIRIGTAEIYRAVEKLEAVKDALIVNLERPDGSDFMPLFLVLHPGYVLNDALQKEINQLLRNTYSPRHVPDVMVEVPDIPYTISGKKLEAPVKKILLGKADRKSMNLSSIRNPDSLHFFFDYRWQ